MKWWKIIEKKCVVLLAKVLFNIRIKIVRLALLSLYTKINFKKLNKMKQDKMFDQDLYKNPDKW